MKEELTEQNVRLAVKNTRILVVELETKVVGIESAIKQAKTDEEKEQYEQDLKETNLQLQGLRIFLMNIFVKYESYFLDVI